MSRQERTPFTPSAGVVSAPVACNWPWAFRAFKRVFDLLIAILAAPLLAVMCLLLLALNPVFNRGPLLFRQERMGLHGQTFEIWKFRTMTCDPHGMRGHCDNVEESRITPLGRILRKYRLDELPNFVNVLRGDMSVIGPRPDMVEHARIHAATIPRYGDRFRVKPGITGLAQVRHGYAHGRHAVLRKARNDCIYIERACVLLDLRIAMKTITVMVSGFGAR